MRLRTAYVRFWGVKRTSLFAAQMSAFDPKRTQGLISSPRSLLLALPDLARDVRLDRNRASAAKRNEEDQGTETETRGETMIRTENLRSAFTKDDVDEYLYKLLPERDAVVREIEDYAAEHRIPIIGPAVARLLSLLVQVSGAKRIFEMGSAIGYSTIWLARAAGPKGKIFYTDGDTEKV